MGTTQQAETTAPATAQESQLLLVGEANSCYKKYFFNNQALLYFVSRNLLLVEVHSQ